MLLKISGCLLVIAATTLTGITRADKIQEQYRQMRVLQRLLYMLESEIRYAHTHLGEIFLRVSRRVMEHYRDWLLSMEKRMGQTDSGTFEMIRPGRLTGSASLGRSLESWTWNCSFGCCLCTRNN